MLDGSRPKDECEPGSENGAFRHTLWQATITPEFDTRTEEEAGNAHEDNPNTDLAIRIFSNLSEAGNYSAIMNVEYQELINVILRKKAQNDILYQNLHVYVYVTS